MNQQQLDDLIMAATQAENEEAVLRLSKEIPNVDPALLKQSSGNFDLLFDAWEESIYKSEEKSSICLFLAEHCHNNECAYQCTCFDNPEHTCLAAVHKEVGKVEVCLLCKQN